MIIFDKGKMLVGFEITLANHIIGIMTAVAVECADFVESSDLFTSVFMLVRTGLHDKGKAVGLELAVANHLFRIMTAAEAECADLVGRSDLSTYVIMLMRTPE